MLILTEKNDTVFNQRTCLHKGSADSGITKAKIGLRKMKIQRK